MSTAVTKQEDEVRAGATTAERDVFDEVVDGYVGMYDRESMRQVVGNLLDNMIDCGRVGDLVRALLMHGGEDGVKSILASAYRLNGMGLLRQELEKAMSKLKAEASEPTAKQEPAAADADSDGATQTAEAEKADSDDDGRPPQKNRDELLGSILASCMCLPEQRLAPADEE